MGIDESEASRLFRGDVPTDDPIWGEVSSFLDSVGTAYPPVSTTAFEGHHLAAVARESRLVHTELQHNRQGAVKRLFQGTNRVLAGSVGAFLIALTAGVGVASALGINPLEQLLHPRPAPSSAVPQAVSQKATSTDTADGKKDRDPGTATQPVPGSVPTPTALPTPSASADDDDAAEESAKAEQEAEKASAKAEKEAEKASAKAEKEAEKASAKAEKEAEKEAEKAAKEAEKNARKATPAPTATPTSGKDKDKGDD
jgi:hypothetical protein